MKTKAGTDLTQLRRLINGYQVTQALHVLAVLRIPDELAAGPRPVNDLATAVGANESALYRVLRAAAAIGVLEELPGHLVGRPYHQAAWARLVDGVRTGEVPFRIEFGTDIWTYRREHALETPIFNRAMNSLTGSVTESIVAGYDFSRFGLVVDVGGGGGALLVAILNRFPSVRGVLFDLPHVVADSRTFIDESGFGDRIQLVGGSFLEEVPPGGDAYVLKSVLHNWDDDGARRILKACRQAMTGQARLLVLERLIPGPNEGTDVKFMDINMFVGPGSFERTAEEWERLFDIGGFKLLRITPVGVFVVIEATPA